MAMRHYRDEYIPIGYVKFLARLNVFVFWINIYITRKRENSIGSSIVSPKALWDEKNLQ